MNRKIIFVSIIIIILSGACLVEVSSSRYLSEITATGSLDVAIPQIVVNAEETTISDMIPGDTRTYEFSVKNYDETLTNEILMEYYIVLKVIEEGFPLTYEIYDVTDNSEQILSKTDNGYGPITLNYETQEEKKFKIVFTWDESDNSETYANKQYTFKIEINATQVI